MSRDREKKRSWRKRDEDRMGRIGVFAVRGEKQMIESGRSVEGTRGAV